MSASELQIDIVAQLKSDVEGQFAKIRTQLDQLKNAETQFTSAQQKANDEMVKSTTGLKSWASAMPRILTAVTGLSTAVLNSVRAHRDLGNVQTDLNQAELRLSQALEKRDKAQDKVNTLIEKGKTDTPKYRAAVLDLVQAQDNLSIKTDLWKEAQEKAADTFQDFYLSLIPTGLGIMSSLGTVAQEVSKHQAAHAAALKAAGYEVVELSKGMKLLTVVMRAIPLVALAAALLAIKTNAGGFRDALNDIGKKLGEMVPELKPLLQWIKDVAEAFGLTEKKMDLSKAFKLLQDGFNGAIETIKKIDWGAVVTKIGTDIETAMNNWNWDTAWQSFKDAIGSTSAWLGPVMTEIGKFILDFIAAEGPKWWAGFQEALGATGTWIGIQIAKLGGYIATEITKVAVTWWTGFAKSLGDPKTLALLVSPIGLIGTEIARLITSGAPEWWKPFLAALGTAAKDIGTYISQVGTEIMNYITKNKGLWWKEFITGLGTAATFVGTEMVKIGDAILKFDWAAIGSGIWTKIAQGIQGAVGGIGEAFGSLGKQIQDAFGGLLNLGDQKPGAKQTSFNMGQSTKGKKVDETGALVDQATGGGGAGGLGIAAMFVKEMTLATAAVKAGVTAITTALAKIGTTFLQLQTSVSASIIGISKALLGMSTNASLVPPVFMKMATTVSTTMLQMQSAVSNVIIGISQAILGLATNANLVPPIFMKMATTVSSTMLQMQSAVSNSIIGMSQAFLGVAQVLATFSNTVIQQTTKVSASFLAMKTSVTGSITQTQSAASSFSTSIASYMSSMSSRVSSFASSFSSAMKTVTSQANSAAAAVKKLQAAVNALKSKTITVHVNLSGPGAGYVQHGGSFIPGLNPRARPGGQHGFGGIVDTPTTFRGVRMGEGFAPELVTVTPLTRGTGNHGGPTVQSGRGFGGGGAAPVINVTVVLDGRVIQRFVEKTALAGIGVQI